jgi:hypothetical protein
LTAAGTGPEPIQFELAVFDSIKKRIFIQKKKKSGNFADFIV